MKWYSYNPNPNGNRVEDCTVRALAKALDLTWDDAFWVLADKANAMRDMMHNDTVWGAVLAQHGFTKHLLPNTCPLCYTAGEFARDHPNGTYVLAFGGHTATVKGGRLWDSWDSSNLPVIYYWEKGK